MSSFEDVAFYPIGKTMPLTAETNIATVKSSAKVVYTVI
jgi:hypothetical protein